MGYRVVISGGSRGSVEPLDFEKTEMEYLNFLEFLEEKVLRKSLLSIRSVISIKVCVHIQRLHRKIFPLHFVPLSTYLFQDFTS